MAESRPNREETLARVRQEPVLAAALGALEHALPSEFSDVVQGLVLSAYHLGANDATERFAGIVAALTMPAQTRA